MKGLEEAKRIISEHLNAYKQTCLLEKDWGFFASISGKSGPKHSGIAIGFLEKVMLAEDIPEIFRIVSTIMFGEKTPKPMKNGLGNIVLNICEVTDIHIQTLAKTLRKKDTPSEGDIANGPFHYENSASSVIFEKVLLLSEKENGLEKIEVLLAQLSLPETTDMIPMKKFN